MNLNAIRKRVEALESLVAAKRGDGGVMLSPADVAALLIERFALDDAPGDIEILQRIDVLLESHKQACTRSRLEPMTAADAARALIEATEHDTEEFHRERITKLLATQDA